MGKYVKCPRCELNYILENEDYCPVCKAEMKMEGYTLLEEDEEELLCPVCKVNYLDDGEKICPECKRKKAEKAVDDEFDTIPLKEEIEEEPEIVVDEIEEILPVDDIIEEEFEENIGDAGFYEIDPEEEETDELSEPETKDDFEEDFENALEGLDDIDYDEDESEDDDTDEFEDDEEIR